MKVTNVAPWILMDAFVLCVEGRANTEQIQNGTPGNSKGKQVGFRKTAHSVKYVSVTLLKEHQALHPLFAAVW